MLTMLLPDFTDFPKVVVFFIMLRYTSSDLVNAEYDKKCDPLMDLLYTERFKKIVADTLATLVLKYLSTELLLLDEGKVLTNVDILMGELCDGVDINEIDREWSTKNIECSRVPTVKLRLTVNSRETNDDTAPFNIELSLFVKLRA